MDPKSSFCMYSSKPFPPQPPSPFTLSPFVAPRVIYDGKLSGNS